MVKCGFGTPPFHVCMHGLAVPSTKQHDNYCFPFCGSGGRVWEPIMFVSPSQYVGRWPGFQKRDLHFPNHSLCRPGSYTSILLRCLWKSNRRIWKLKRQSWKHRTWWTVHNINSFSRICLSRSQSVSRPLKDKDCLLEQVFEATPWCENGYFLERESELFL